MPNIKSAKKRVKVQAKKAANNKAANTALKTAIKKANAAIEANAADIHANDWFPKHLKLTINK